MKEDLIICDTITFELPKGKKVLDGLKASITQIKDSASGIPALEVTLDATHGGFVNRNFSFYKPEGQKKGAKSFVSPFPKPVLVEHDDTKSPIGRVMDSEFVAMPGDDKNPNSPKSKIRLKTQITDMDAIQKILDGRYMTVSISGSPKTPPHCSICDEVVKGGFMSGCSNDHIRGQMYDGKPCYYIWDELNYSEVSFVNKPADQSDGHAAGVVGLQAVEAKAMSAEETKAMEALLAVIKAGSSSDSVTIADDECQECKDSYWTEDERKQIAAIVEAGEDTPEDGKLSTEQRKKLSSGTFCGPARSYPVPDCSHGANAKARATQQVKAGKLSASTAAKIKACADRKMKSMGCGGGKDALALTTGNPIIDSLLEMIDDLKSLYGADIQAVEAKVAEHTQATADLKKANETLQAQLAEAEKIIAQLKSEKDSLTKEAATLKDAVTKAEAKHATALTDNTALNTVVREAKINTIIALSILAGKDGLLSVFSGQNSDERADSLKKKAQEYKDIPVGDLTKKENELISELTKQPILRPDLGSVGGGDSLTNEFKDRLSRVERVKKWFHEGL